jgi:NAD(P)-dependent dehydrogenase (short-subunit alcohol dehydrogenase family)
MQPLILIRLPLYFKRNNMSKVVLVTGGSSGIGKSICLYLHQKGFVVYGTSRNPDRYKNDLPFKLIALDVLDASTIMPAIKTIIDKEGRLDVLINNAGIGMLGSIEDSTAEEVKEVFETNVYGILRTIQAVLPHMRERRSGLIINVSSIAGYMGLPYRGIYSATKASVHMITEAMRMELKPYGVHACVVDPGDFATNISENRRVAKAGRTGTVYVKEIHRIEAIINKEVAHSSDPILMGKAIEKIMQASNPDINYVVGNPMQKLSIFVRRLVPKKWFEKIIASHYKLPN